MSYIPFKEVREEITREHILEALKEMKANGLEHYATSTGFDLKYKGDKYPPKEVIQEAVRIKYGDGAGTGLNGGGPTNDPLLDLGFKIYMKDGRKYEKGMKCRTLKKKKIQTKKSKTTVKPSQQEEIFNKAEKTDIPLTRRKAIEGALFELKTMARKRNSGIAKTCKQKDGHTCQACGFNYPKVIVECHHLRPMAHNKNSEVEINLKDLITLCPTCHRLAHHLIKGPGKGKKYTQRISLLKELKKIRQKS